MIKFERLGVKMSPREDQLGKFARFNPGIAVKDGIVHMLYRATNSDIADKSNYISAIGYAKLDMEGNVLYDSNQKVIYPTTPEESMGCEDPRIVEFEGNYYIFYTAYNGPIARVGIAKTIDFKTYEKIGYINHFAWDKDAFILPERVNGKIVYIHRIEPSIQIDYFNSIEELVSDSIWEGYQNRVMDQIVMRSEFEWESKKIGGSAPPIKTDRGWLFIYHGVTQSMIYRAGVALLDLTNPSRVIARIPYPLLEPVEDYELYGDVPNVVFPEGAYIHEGYLYTYYGAADKYIALARINVGELLEELEKYKI